MNIHNIIKDLKQNFFKKNKKMFIVSIVSFFLIILVTSFSKQDIIKAEKLDFYVETRGLEDFNSDIEINKPGKIIGAQEIVISSQAMGSIKKININEGIDVGYNTNIVELNDDVANYGILVQRTKNALNSARLQYQQNKNQLELGISNSQLTLERSKNSLNTTQTLGEQNIRGAENSLSNSNSQKNSLVLQMESEKNKIITVLNDILHKNDTILGVTNQYKTNNDSYEIYLSAKASSFKLQGESQLLALYKQKEILSNLKITQDTSNSELKNNITKIDNIYQEIIKFLDTMENILIKSVNSTTFSQTQIDGLIANNDMLQSSIQTNFTYFTSFKQSADSTFIENGNGEFILGNETADIGYQSTIASTQQQLSDAKIGLQTAELNYENALKNKNSTLGLASTNITSAELAYQEAQKQYDKLIIKTPITGTIGKILVDKGQQVSIGTPILTIINNSDPIVEVGITATEYKKINSGSMVTVEYMGEVLSGEIISIGSQTEGNGLYNVIIKLGKQIDIIGDSAKIRIFSNIDKFTLPLNIVHPLEKNNGYIYIIKDKTPEIFNIKLGEIRGDRVEILTEIPNDIQIVTNDISNYNPNIHTLILK